MVWKFARLCGTLFMAFQSPLFTAMSRDITVMSTMHGNRVCKRPRIGTVQVMGTIAAIVKENADQMPHQMRGIVHGRMDTLKYLPASNN